MSQHLGVLAFGKFCMLPASSGPLCVPCTPWLQRIPDVLCCPMLAKRVLREVCIMRRLSHPLVIRCESPLPQPSIPSLAVRCESPLPRSSLAALVIASPHCRSPRSHPSSSNVSLIGTPCRSPLSPYPCCLLSVRQAHRARVLCPSIYNLVLWACTASLLSFERTLPNAQCVLGAVRCTLITSIRSAFVRLCACVQWRTCSRASHQKRRAAWTSTLPRSLLLGMERQRPSELGPLRSGPPQNWAPS